MSVQSACVTRQPLERSGWLSAALSLLAIMGNLPPPRTKGQNPWPHITPQYKTFFPRVQLMAGQSVEVYVKRVGDLSQALTQNVQIEGKSDSFPPRFDPTDNKNFDLSKTEKSLTVTAVSANAEQITIQKRDGDVYELQDRFDVLANATYAGTTFEDRLKEGCIAEEAQPTVDLIADPDPFMITAGEKRTVTFLMDVIPAPYSVNVCYSNVLRHWMSAEVLGGDETSIANHGRTSGRLVIPADGGTTSLDVQTMEDRTPKFEEEPLVAFHFEGHTSITTKHRAVCTFNSDSAIKMVMVKIMDDDTPQPNQHLVNLHGSTPDKLTNRPQAALKDGENSELSVTRIGDTALSNVPIPFEFKRCPADKAISSGDRTPASMPIRSVQEPGSMTLQTIDDSMDKGYNELPTIKIDGDSEIWLKGNSKVEHSQFVVVMTDNDKTLANLLKLSDVSLTEAVDARRATCQLQLTRRPIADSTETTPFGSAGNDEGIAGINR